MYRKSIQIFKVIAIIKLCLNLTVIRAQGDFSKELSLGDPAPALQVDHWLKGEPYNNFEKGTIYVLEFWATWCKPCIAAMPHFSEFARKYRDKIKVLSVNVLDDKASLQRKKHFVDSMGIMLDYDVVTDKDNFMGNNWVKATWDPGIPRAIIVNTNGKIAWVGHPKDIDTVITGILSNTWDIQNELAKVNLKKYLSTLGDSVNREIVKFLGNEMMPPEMVLFEPVRQMQPDSMLLYINNIVKYEPRLEFEYAIVHYKFLALLQIDLQKALAYGQNVLAHMYATGDYEVADALVWSVESCSGYSKLTPEIYEIGAEAYQLKINQYPYPQLANIPKYYHKMSWFYWLAKNRQKAVEAASNAVTASQSYDFVYPSEMALYKAQLELYKTCDFDR